MTDISRGRVAGKVALISGGSQGLGASHAKLLAAEGAKVVISDIKDAAGEALANELGDAAIFVRLDVTEGASWARAVAAAERAFGPISILVNNAGILEAASLDSMELSSFQRVIDVNLIGTFLGIQAATASMKKAGGGSIINTSSVAGHAPFPLMAGYVASKHAIEGLTKVAALDLAQFNIRVNNINPGTIDTPMQGDVEPIKPKRQPIARLGQPIEVSRMVIFLASDDASFCTGASYVVDGGYLSVVGDSI